MKIVLCTSPFKKTDFRWPPIGLLYIASYLKSKSNHEIKVIDGFSGNIDENQFINQIAEERPEIIGFSCTSFTFLKSMELLQKVKALIPDVIIVVGGIHATFFAEKIVENYKFVDFVVKGEGEIAFTELIQNLHDREKLKNLSGLTFIDNNKVINNEEKLIQDLDSLPFPDRKLVANNEYSHCWFDFKLTDGNLTTLLTSRSCPYSCTFCCCSTLFKRKWRARSVDNILDELEEIYSQGYKTCVFVDDNFTLIPERVIEVCQGIVKRKIKMDLHCEGRVDKASLKILREMKNAGFSTILFGAESGLQKVLDYYNKGIKVEHIEDAVRNAKKVGMNVIGSFIIGAPIETRQDVISTLEFASSLRILLSLNPLGIVPGTKLWAQLEEMGKIGEDDWKNGHSVSEYYENFPEEELQDLVNFGYKLFIDKMKSSESLRDLLMLLSSRSMKTILWNILKHPIPLMKQLIKLQKENFQPFKQ